MAQEITDYYIELYKNNESKSLREIYGDLLIDKATLNRFLDCVGTFDFNNRTKLANIVLTHTEFENTTYKKLKFEILEMMEEEKQEKLRRQKNRQIIIERLRFRKEQLELKKSREEVVKVLSKVASIKR